MAGRGPEPDHWTPSCDSAHDSPSATIYIHTASYYPQIIKSKLHKAMKGWLLVGVVTQWQSTDTVSQRPWVRFPTAPPFFQALYQLFQSSTDSDGQIKVFKRPNLSNPRTKFIGVPTIRLPAAHNILINLLEVCL